MKIQVPEPEESRSADDASIPQRLASVAGHPKNCLYIDSGASIHILFNKELLGGIVDLNKSIKIQAGGKPIHLSQIGSLHQALRHLPLPVSCTTTAKTPSPTCYHLQSLQTIIILSVTPELTTRYMCRARMMVNTYVFRMTTI